MYEIIATNDFVELIKEIPLKSMKSITNSFMSIKKINEENIENTFMLDLMEQIKNQEIE